MVHHQALPVGQEHDTAILEGSHPHNLVIPHLLPLLISLHEEAIPHYIRTLQAWAKWTIQPKSF